MTSPENPGYFMRKVNNLAEEAIANGELPIAALVVFNNKIIASSFAKDRSEKRRLVHAELLTLELLDKIKPFPGKRKEMSLFVNLEPCLMCLGAALVFGVGNIYFSLESPIDGATKYMNQYGDQISTIPGYEVASIHSGLERQRTLELFKNYQDNGGEDGYHRWVGFLIQSLNE